MSQMKGKRMVDRRVFLIVLDSYGIGELPDAADFGDMGCNTLRSITASKEYAYVVLRVDDNEKCNACLIKNNVKILTPEDIAAV